MNINNFPKFRSIDHSSTKYSLPSLYKNIRVALVVKNIGLCLFYLGIAGIASAQQAKPFILAEHKTNINLQENTSLKLYANALNRLILLTSGLEKDYQVKVLESGYQVGGEVAEILRIGDTLQVVPSRTGTFALDFTNKEPKKERATLGYECIEIPPPDVTIIDSETGLLYDLNREVKIKNLGKIYVRVTPDEQFSRLCPDDDAYKVSSLTISLAGGKRLISSLRASNGFADLSSLKEKCNPGDRIVIELDQVIRMDYKGNIINVVPKHKVLRFFLIN